MVVVDTVKRQNWPCAGILTDIPKERVDVNGTLSTWTSSHERRRLIGIPSSFVSPTPIKPADAENEQR